MLPFVCTSETQPASTGCKLESLTKETEVPWCSVHTVIPSDTRLSHTVSPLIFTAFVTVTETPKGRLSLFLCYCLRSVSTWHWFYLPTPGNHVPEWLPAQSPSTWPGLCEWHLSVLSLFSLLFSKLFMTATGERLWPPCCLQYSWGPSLSTRSHVAQTSLELST